MKCPICESVTNNILKHKLIDCDILKCSNCYFTFVDCEGYSHEEISQHQKSHVSGFGNNLIRNDSYIKYLSKINISINNLLEIGTPPNYDFLKKVNKNFPKISLYSHDIIKNELPNYIEFHENKETLLTKDIDILFCIHTLEHIPTNQLKDFVQFVKNVSKYFVFEVPYCKTKDRIVESSTNPHYSFFTEDSITNLFGDVNITINNKIMKFTNIKK
tara:strand:+ start:22426 stop:23073 length:648 start_codon:yes stop_codon:yes gene_type:complete